MNRCLSSVFVISFDQVNIVLALLLQEICSPACGCRWPIGELDAILLEAN